MQAQSVESQLERFDRRQTKRITERKPQSAEGALMGKELCDELINTDATRFDSDLDAKKGLELLDTSGVSSAPVVDDNGVLIGVVFLSTLARLRERRGLEVEDAMRTDVVTASQRTTVAEVARLMAKHDLDRLPVITNDGHLVGVVSAMDLVRWLARSFPDES